MATNFSFSRAHIVCHQLVELYWHKKNENVHILCGSAHPESRTFILKSYKAVPNLRRHSDDGILKTYEPRYELEGPGFKSQ
jgi:hypothetical protein